MRKDVQKYIQEHNMLQAGDQVVLGVSGGADSVGLLHVLWELKGELGIELQVVHVHHGLRGAEADRDAVFVEELCASLGIRCQVAREDVREYAARQGISEEEAGRELRYRRFQEAADRWASNGETQNARTLIAVAHHREDQAETILHNLFRGSGLKGLGGMMPVRGNIIRPLLGVSKQEILTYLQEAGIPYCEDSTNGESDYTRNKLRNQLIPQICKDINAGAVDHIVSAGRRLAQADMYFEQEAARLWEAEGQMNYKDARANQPGGEMWPDDREICCGIQVAILLKQPEILQGYLIRHMLKQCSQSMKDIAAVHIEQVLALTSKGTGHRISLPYGLEACREYETLWITTKERQNTVDSQQPRPDMAKHLKMSDFPYEKHEKIPKNQYTKWFDYDKIKGALSVRTRKIGDFITLADGKHKTVKSYMIDEKIPRQLRDEILLLAEGSHVLWIVGYRISEYYKVTEETRHILQVQVVGGEEHGR